MNNRKFRNWLKRSRRSIAPGDSAEIQKALNGDVAATWNCLTWNYSPQGWEFWTRVAVGAKLSKRTRRFLAKLRDESKRMGY